MCRSPRRARATGIPVETIDLFDLLGRAGRLGDGDEAVTRKLAAIRDYVACAGIPEQALLKMARFGAAVEAWVAEQ